MLLNRQNLLSITFWVVLTWTDLTFILLVTWHQISDRESCHAGNMLLFRFSDRSLDILILGWSVARWVSVRLLWSFYAKQTFSYLRLDFLCSTIPQSKAALLVVAVTVFDGWPNRWNILKQIQLSPTSPKTQRVENTTGVRESLGMFISVENSLKMEPKVAKVSGGWLSYFRVCIAFFV